MANYYAEPSDIAAEGYFRNMAAQDAREANAYNRQRVERQDAITNRKYQQEQAQQAAEMAIEALAGGADEGQVAAFLTEIGNDIGSPFDAATHMPVLKGQAKTRMSASGGLGLTPIPVKNADGSIDLYQPSSGGTPLRMAFPEGSSPLVGNVMQVDQGTQTSLINQRTGQPVAPPLPTSPNPSQMPEFRADVVAAEEAAKVAAIPARNRAEIDAAIEKAAVTAQQDAVRALPAAIDKAEAAMKVIDSLASHPGLPYLVGMYSMAPVVPNTDQAGADAYMKQIEGQAFLEAYASLRGTGQITQIEGEKATNALLRLSRRQDKDAYVQGLDELREVIEKGLERAKKSAMPKNQLSSLQKNIGDKLSTSVDLPVGTVDGGYEFLGGDPSNPESWKKVQ